MRTITLAIAMAVSFSAMAHELKPANTQSKPLSFIENKGQIVDQHGTIRKDIDVKLETPGMSIFIGDGAIHYQWRRETNSFRYLSSNAGDNQDEQSNIETYRMDVELVGSNRRAEAVLEEKQQYYENYYLPQFADRAIAYTYNRITYKNVYPGIDWVLYSKANQVKYDFVVHSGADPKQIQLKYSGATELTLVNGALHVKTPYGSLIEAAPFSYDAETEEPIQVSYMLAENIVQFLTPAYEKDFVIDPILNWGTYYGGAGTEVLTSLISDTAGNAYATGRTVSTTNVATSGAHQQLIGGSEDGWLVKFNAAGSRLWATYYGGAGNDRFHAIACSGNGDIYIVGGTASTGGITTMGVHQPVYAGGQGDGIIVKFNNAGQRLWASYYGGTGDELITTLALGQGGAVYIAGSIDGGTGISTTPGAYQTTSAASFIASFNASGVRQWGTYLGDDTHIFALTADLLGNIFATGATGASTFIPTPGTHEASFLSPSGYEAFIVKFNSTGARLWGTYYGGLTTTGSLVEGHGLATDNTGNIYLCGTTSFVNSALVTTGAHQTTYQGSHEGFLAKFSPVGIRQWGTYYGGSGLDHLGGIDVGPDGNIYMAGSTYSSTSIATIGSHQPGLAGSSDAFLVMFDPNGTRQWASYYGGTSLEQSATVNWTGYGKVVACGGKGQIYVGGVTSSTGGIATTGAFQIANGGNEDAFIAQFQMDQALYILNPGDNLQLCKGDSMTVVYGVSASFGTGNSFSLQLSNSSGSFASATTLATVNGTAGGTIKIPVPVSVTNGSGYRMRIVASNPAKTSNDNGLDINISQYPTKPVAAATNPVCTGQTLAFTVGTQSGVTWSWIGPNSFTSNIQNPNIVNVASAASGDYIVTADLAGCARKDTVSVTVGTTPAKPVANNNSPICAGATFNLTANSTTPGVSYSWNGPLSFNSTQQNPNITAATPGHAGDYIVSAILGNCSAKDTTTVVINSVASLGAYASPNDTFCEGTQANFVAVPFNGGASPQFQWYKNGTQIPGATGMVYTTTSIVSGDSFYCRMIATGICTDPLELYSPGIKVVVLPITSTPSVTISSNPTLPQPGQLSSFAATALNGGPNPTFQWLRNGQPVIGAIGANWSASTLHPFDKISCVVFSSDPCAVPKTDTSEVIIVNFPTVINDVAIGGKLAVYPNPTSGFFTISHFAEFARYLKVEVSNALGQIVYSDTKNNPPSNCLFELPSTCGNGVYLLRFDDGTASYFEKLIVEK